jgi:hypothetical protein
MPEKTVKREIWEWMIICATASIGLGLSFGITWIASVQGDNWAWWQILSATILTAIGFGVVAPLGYIASLVMAISTMPYYGTASDPEKKE